LRKDQYTVGKLWLMEKEAQQIAQRLDAYNDLLAAVGSAIWVLNNRHNKDKPEWEGFAVAAEEDCCRALAKAKGKG